MEAAAKESAHGMPVASVTAAETTCLEEVRIVLTVGMKAASDIEAETVELNWAAAAVVVIDKWRETIPEIGCGWIEEACPCSCFSPLAFSSPPVSSLSASL